MKKLLHIAALALSLAAARATQTNVLYGTVGDYGLSAQRATVRLTLVYPNPRYVGAVLVRQDPVARPTDASGGFAFTNIQWGDYVVSISGAPGTDFPISVGTNAVGPIPISSLALPGDGPPDPGTNYYTQAQVDALLVGAVFQPALLALLTNDLGSASAAWWPSNHFATTNLGAAGSPGLLAPDGSTIVAVDGVLTVVGGGGGGGGYQLQVLGALLTLQTNQITLVYTIAGVDQTNALRPASGFSAFVPTNRFDVSGAAGAVQGSVNLHSNEWQNGSNDLHAAIGGWGSTSPVAYSNSLNLGSAAHTDSSAYDAAGRALTATNGQGIASGLSAMVNTNRFEVAGAGVAAATAATNGQGVASGLAAMVSTNRFEISGAAAAVQTPLNTLSNAWQNGSNDLSAATTAIPRQATNVPYAHLISNPISFNQPNTFYATYTNLYGAAILSGKNNDIGLNTNDLSNYDPDGVVNDGLALIADGSWSGIASGASNRIAARFSFIGGGLNNISLWSSGNGVGDFSFIGGGLNNKNNGAEFSFIGGGQGNYIEDGASWQVLVGGVNNKESLYGTANFLGGGATNSIIASQWSTLAGGKNNTIADSNEASIANNVADYNVLGGGRANTIINTNEDAIDVNYSVIPGGVSNRVFSSQAWAGGTKSTAAFPGSFVWSDSLGGAGDTGPNQWVIQSSGGFFFNGGPVSGNFTALNASSISTGTLSPARLSFGTSNFVASVAPFSGFTVTYTTNSFGVVTATLVNGNVLTNGSTLDATKLSGLIPQGSLLSFILTNNWQGTIATAGLNVSGGFTNGQATANTLAMFDANKKETSLANGGANTVAHGTTPPAYSAVVESDLGLTDVTTGNASSSAHGFLAKLPNDVTKVIDGTGAGVTFQGTNAALDTATLAPTSNATNYSSWLRSGLVGTHTIFGANSNISLSLTGTNLADVTRTLFVNNYTSSVNCNIAFTFTYATNQNFSAVVSNGWSAYFTFHNPDTTGTNVSVLDAGRMHH